MGCDTVGASGLAEGEGILCNSLVEVSCNSHTMRGWLSSLVVAHAAAAWLPTGQSPQRVGGPVATPVDEAAFLRLITVPLGPDPVGGNQPGNGNPSSLVEEMASVYERHGIVHVPGWLSEDEAQSLARAADACGLRRDAYGQPSQGDRFTLWLAGDGIEESDGADGSAELSGVEATEAVQEQAPCAGRAFLDSSGWREVASRRGYSHLALAEVVTSLPGGSPQRWHFDGEGVKAQIALTPITQEQGPTELAPRVLPGWYVRESEFLAGAITADDSPLDVASRLLPRLPDLVKMAARRPLYDLTSAAHAAAWAALRPALLAVAAIDEQASAALAAAIVSSGLTPPVVRLEADVGSLTLYDSAMVHRGGANVGERPRPILAVHVRADGDYGPNAKT